MPATSPNQGGPQTRHFLRCWKCCKDSTPANDPHSAERLALEDGWHVSRNYPLRPECPQCHNHSLWAA